MALKSLIEILNSNPKIQEAYFDKNGGWLLVKKNNHPIVKTREQIFKDFEESPESREITVPATDEEAIQMLNGRIEELASKIEELLTLNAQLTTENAELQKQLDEQI